MKLDNVILKINGKVIPCGEVEITAQSDIPVLAKTFLTDAGPKEVTFTMELSWTQMWARLNKMLRSRK